MCWWRSSDWDASDWDASDRDASNLAWESSWEHDDQKYVVRKKCDRDTLLLTYFARKSDCRREIPMKLRMLSLAAVALAVLAVAVVPANAKHHHRHHHPHHHSK
jgi:hypothetical protein